MKRWDDLTPETHATVRMALIIFAASLVVFSVCATMIGRPIVLRDAFEYNASAQRLLNTGVFQYTPDVTADIDTAQGPTAFMMPGYTLFLTAIYLFHAHSGDAASNVLGAQLAIIAVQLVLASMVPALLAVAGRRLGGGALGWVAGVLGVAYLPFGINATVTLSETLALFTMALLLIPVVELSKRPLPDGTAAHLHPTMVAFGLLGGLAVLVRPIAAGWLCLFLAAWVALNHKQWRWALRLAGIGAACVLLVLTPWIARNAISLERFVPLTTSSSMPLLDSVGGASFTPAEEAAMKRATENGDDPIRAVAMARIRDRWAADPLGFLRQRIGNTLTGVSLPAVLPVDILIELQEPEVLVPGGYADAGAFRPAQGSPTFNGLLNATIWLHRIVLALALVGVMLGFRRRSIWMIASIPAYYAVVHTLILFMIRYFYPAMPALLLLAAYGVVGTWHLVRRSAAARS